MASVSISPEAIFAIRSFWAAAGNCCSSTSIASMDAMMLAIDPWTCSDLAPKFYPVLSSLQRFLVAVVGSVAAGCGAEP
ncbi:hypothetical protein ACC676_38205, partial [Rhizobium ruizarguesonis]